MPLRKNLLIALIVCFTTVAYSATVELPSIGDTSESFLSTDEEQRLGEAFMRNIRQTLKISDDPEITSYIQSLGYRLTENSDASSRNFTFFVVDNFQINAFAGPGGYIGINTGLILATESEGELASVVAHEIAHVTQRHLARAFETASKMSLPTTAAIIAAIIIGQENSQLGEAAIAATIAGSIQQQINFTRENEEEADRLGVKILAKSDYDPRAMPLFFERLQKSNRFVDNQQLEFLRTHPVTPSRISDTRNRAEQYPLRHIRSEKSYALIKAKLHLKAEEDAQNSADYFKRLLDGDNNLSYPDTAKYGYALALHDLGKYSDARSQIHKLIKKDPEIIAYQIALAMIEMSDDKIEQSLKIYESNLLLFPNNHPLTILYSTALIQNGSPKKAKTIMEQHLRHTGPTPEIYSLLAQAESASGNKVESHQVLAEYYYHSGQTKMAIEQLKIALKSVEKSASLQTARMKARLKQFQEEQALTAQ